MAVGAPSLHLHTSAMAGLAGPPEESIREFDGLTVLRTTGAGAGGLLIDLTGVAVEQIHIVPHLVAALDQVERVALIVEGDGALLKAVQVFGSLAHREIRIYRASGLPIARSWITAD